MKRAALILLILALPCLIFATTMAMKLIPLSSPIYKYVDDLYVLEGLAAPEGARPWNIADLRQQISRIEPTGEASKAIMATIEKYLDQDDSDGIVSMDWNIGLYPSTGTHSNTTFDTQDDWAEPVLNDKLIRFNGSLHVADYFSADFGLALGFANSATTGSNLDSSDEERFSENFATNIPFVSSGNIDLDITDNAYISAGTQYVSFTLGRWQLSMGNGLMGNMILSNTLPYHDYINLSASNNSWFDYDLIMSFFLHPMNYTSDEGYHLEDSVNGLQMFINHRFEFRMFSDKLRLTLNEAIMYQSTDNTIDFRIFNPLLIMHGHYIPAQANSLASIELEYAPIRNLQLYASFAVDDLSVGESVAPEKNSTLNMWGIMGGLRSTVPFGRGYFSINAEAVYTSPLMYHKDPYSQEGEEYLYTLDFIGSVRFMGPNSASRIYRQYLSFPFGGDALAGIVEFGYTVPQGWEAGARFFCMAHGVSDKNSINRKYDGETSEVPDWLMTQNPFDKSEKGVISYTFDFGLEGTWYIMPNLSISSSFDMIHIINMDNLAGNDQTDVQFTVSIGYTIF